MNYRLKGKYTTGKHHHEQTIAEGCREAQPSPSDIIHRSFSQFAAEVCTKEPHILVQIDAVQVCHSSIFFLFV